jgi:RsiW-degrading membrane proteinase PrsW (M82 family)
MKKYVFSFLGGTLCVSISFLLQDSFFATNTPTLDITSAWAVIEETLKIFVVMFTVSFIAVPKKDWWRLAVVVALGFAITENIFFAYNTFNNDGISTMFGLMFWRFFFGAMPLHIVATVLATIGFAKNVKLGIIATLLAILGHTAFNFFITNIESGWRFAIEKIPELVLGSIVIFIVMGTLAISLYKLIGYLRTREFRRGN